MRSRQRSIFCARKCGRKVERAQTLCNQCADLVRDREAEAREAEKSAAQKEADKKSPLLEPSELAALPALETGKDAKDPALPFPVRVWRQQRH